MSKSNRPSDLTRRQRKALKTRKNILDVASTLFSSRSYDNVTMDDISEEVDLSRATLYNYYGSKEAIYFEIGIRSLSDLNEKQGALTKKGGTGLDLVLLLVEDTLRRLFEGSLLQDIIRQYSITNMQSETPAHVILRKIESGEKVEDSLKVALASFLKEIRVFEENWTRVINLGYEDGSIQNELKTEQLTHFLFLIILGIVDRVNLERILLQSIDMSPDKIIFHTIELIQRYLANPYR